MPIKTWRKNQVNDVERFHIIDGKKVIFTAEEEIIRDAEEQEWEEKKLSE